MPIPLFPIPFPQQGVFTECDLKPVRRQAAGVMQSGADVVIDRGGPQWMGTWKTRTLTALEMGAWCAWAASLRGAERTFLGYDPIREYPLAYMPNGGPAAPDVIISGISDSLDEVDLADLPPGFELINGDYMSVAYGTGQVSLHMFLSSGTADGDGNIGPMWIEPELPVSVSDSASVGLIQACGKFRLTKFDAPKTADGGLRIGSVSFEAISVSI